MSLALFPLFVVGLLGSVHCVGMCGGIVGALALTPPRTRGVVIQLHTRRPRGSGVGQAAAYNAGRIASYMAAGALAGALAGGVFALSALPALQSGAYWLANLMLVALGLHLMHAWRGLAQLERGGQALWKRLRPLLSRIGRPDTPLRMFAAGAVWGWLPCAMVYSVLLTAMLSGSAWQGAAVMLAFGLGTLPMLLVVGLAGARLRTCLGQRAVRLSCGALVLGFGVLGLLRAGTGLAPLWLQPLCVTP